MARFAAALTLSLAMSFLPSCSERAKPEAGEHAVRGKAPVEISKAGAAIRQKIIGAWVPEGVNCESDGGVSYRTDGTWGAYDVSGKWHIEADRLVTFIEARGEPDEEQVAVNPPEKSVSAISFVSEEQFEEREAGGAIRRLRRCK